MGSDLSDLLFYAGAYNLITYYIRYGRSPTVRSSDGWDVRTQDSAGRRQYNECSHSRKTIKLNNEGSGVEVADIGDFDEDDLCHTSNGEALTSARS